MYKRGFFRMYKRVFALLGCRTVVSRCASGTALLVLPLRKTLMFEKSSEVGSIVGVMLDMYPAKTKSVI